MKNYIFTVIAAVLLTACEKNDIANDADDVKTVHFCLNGDFSVSLDDIGTRALQADGADMTDVWVFDYMDGILVSQVHQSGSDADFGSPTLRLAMGSHKLCFVASNGKSPAVDAENQTLTWSSMRNVFWNVMDVDVSQSTGSTMSVTLGRVVTRLKISINDEVPAGASQLVVRVGRWCNSMNYLTGEPTNERDNEEMKVNIPSSYVGTTGQLVVSFYGTSSTAEWTTDVKIEGKDASGAVLGSVTIPSVPFKRNRSTDCSGALFSRGSTMGLSLSGEWQEAHGATW